MNEECLICGTAMDTTVKKNHRYTKLLRVVIDEVVVHRCSNCGEEEIEIPRIEEMHAVIAKSVARKPGRLDPGEIRWLRTHLGYSSVALAKAMGVTPESISRWERADDPKQMSLPAERLLRLMALQDKPIENYELETLGAEESSPFVVSLQSENDHWKPSVLAHPCV